MQEEFFYNSSIKTYITAFGNIFNNIQVKHGNGNITKVPVKYSSKEKFIEKYFSTLELTPAIEKIVPVIAYEMTASAYDATRKTNMIHKNVQPNGSKYQEQLNPVPYNFTFTLSIFTRYGEELFQIIEQILPFFQPSFNITIKENEAMNISERDIPVVLNNVTWLNEYVGEKGNRRRLEAELSFTMKGWLYPNITASEGVIKRVLIDFGTTPNEEFHETVEFLVDPWTAKPTDEYEIIERPGFYDPFIEDGLLNPKSWIDFASLTEVIPAGGIVNGRLTKTDPLSAAQGAANNVIYGDNTYLEYSLSIPVTTVNSVLISGVRSDTSNLLRGWWFTVSAAGLAELSFNEAIIIYPGKKIYKQWDVGTFKNNDVVRIEISGTTDNESPQTSKIKVFKNNVLLVSESIYGYSPDLPSVEPQGDYGQGSFLLFFGDAIVEEAIGVNWARVGHI